MLSLVPLIHSSPCRQLHHAAMPPVQLDGSAPNSSLNMRNARSLHFVQQHFPVCDMRHPLKECADQSAQTAHTSDCSNLPACTT